ncbi:cytochrome-c peroxidase, partial [bacterium]|nr:cytochrome-c peroxidase [bacterium]
MLLIASSFFQSCTETNEPSPSFDVNFSIPSNFPAPAYKMKANPITKDGFLLG